MFADSPMLLDETCISIDDEESRCKEGLRKVLTVPQYSSDIYAYLREAEVRIGWFMIHNIINSLYFFCYANI